ncbi:uncharacterized protein LOC105174294 isoform X2 [Sesamum indicum]|uniref:Uncharacterized protein LOC105174294 isoform X2 n=1 Tax=Sesamum indicum TaxID=4182 RepID=A0A8M8V3M7_SESIN|nr:uncharacterized protein LOC105174294 isoform X2 [Sesamum indicum]
MGRTKRRQISIALGLVMLMGIAVYFRLWTIDYRVSSNDTELLRRQFDLANREAMDESAEWRRRYDWEFEKAAECSRQLEEATAIFASVLVFQWRSVTPDVSNSMTDPSLLCT